MTAIRATQPRTKVRGFERRHLLEPYAGRNVVGDGRSTGRDGTEGLLDGPHDVRDLKGSLHNAVESLLPKALVFALAQGAGQSNELR